MRRSKAAGRSPPACSVKGCSQCPDDLGRSRGTRSPLFYRGPAIDVDTIGYAVRKDRIRNCFDVGQRTRTVDAIKELQGFSEALFRYYTVSSKMVIVRMSFVCVKSRPRR